jgi:hypothetical protein
MFPIYGLMFGINYWNTSLDGEPMQEGEEVEHLFQIMIGIIGISFHHWTQRD